MALKQATLFLRFFQLLEIIKLFFADFLSGDLALSLRQIYAKENTSDQLEQFCSNSLISQMLSHSWLTFINVNSMLLLYVNQ